MCMCAGISEIKQVLGSDDASSFCHLISLSPIWISDNSDCRLLFHIPVSHNSDGFG